MSLTDEVALVLKGQNVASPAIEEAIKSLRSFRTIIVSTTGAIDKYNVAAARFVELNRVMVGPQNDLRYVMETTTRAVQAQAVAYRELGTAAAAAGRGTATGTAERTVGTRVGGGGGGGYGIAQQLQQGLLYGGGYLALSGIRAGVTQAIDFNATAASTQATTGISAQGLQQVTQGIMQIAGSGKSRYDANTLLQGAYAIISTGVTDPKIVLQQLQAAAASATAANAQDVLPSTSALTTVMNAYGTTSGAMKYQDIISMAINQGKADPTQVPGAMATFARSAKTAGVSFAQAAGFFAFDTLASRDAQTSGQDMDAFFRLVNNPNMASRTFAKKVPGLEDWGTGMVGRAGGLNQWLQKVLAATAGPEQGLLLARLFNNAPALAAVEGAAADPAKFSQYIRNAPGTLPGGGSITQRGADTFLASDAGKLYSATNELKTEFQKFTTGAIPLMTTAVQDLTAGMRALGVIGNSMDELSRRLNIPANATSGLLGLGNLFGVGPTGRDAYGVAGGAAQETLGGARSVAPFDTQGQTRSNQPLYSAGWYSQMGYPLGGRNQVGYFPGTAPVLGESNAGSALSSRALASALRDPTATHPNLASAVGGVGIGAETVMQQAGLVSAVQFASRTSGTRKTGDMTSAQATLNLAMATNQSPSTINAARKDLIAAITNSGMDPQSIAYAIFQANNAVAAYQTAQAAQVASTAATQTQAGYAHVQAVLSNAQFSGTGIGAAQQGEIAFLRSHPTLWGGDPAILQSMINSVTGAAGASAALPKAITERLIRPTLPNDALTANFGTSVDRLTGGRSTARDDTIRELQKQNAQLREEIQVLQGVSHNTKKTADMSEAVARGVGALVAQGSAPNAPSKNLRNLPGARR